MFNLICLIYQFQVKRFSKKTFALVIFFLFSLPICTTFAGNFSVNGVSTRAESTQAFTAVADDPSAIFYNPAGLTQLKDNHAQADAMYLMPHLDYTNSLNNASSVNTKQVVATSTFLTSSKLAPLFFGFGMYAPFARAVNYAISPAVYNFPNYSLIQRIDFAPTVAVKLGQYISLGGSIIGSRVNAASNILGLDESAHGYGATGQGGLLITLPKGFNIGVDYRGPENAHLTGTGTVATPVGLNTENFDLNFQFPGVLSTGVAWQIIQQLLVSVDYDSERWSDMQEVRRNYSNTILDPMTATPVNAFNSDDVRAGIIFRPNQSNEFRVGGSYLGIAVPSRNIVPAQPDYTGEVGSLGYSRYFKQFRFDAGYEYAHLIPRTNDNTLFPGQYSGHLNTVMAGVDYIFS